MDSLDQYRQIIRKLIQTYAQYKPARGDVQLKSFSTKRKITMS
jgi:hypothetical protein